MGISAKTDYACKAMLELSLQWPDKEPVRIQAISRRQNIPLKYLVQILLQLKQLGFVSSVRGKEGGYALNMPPEKITLGHLMRRLSGGLLSKHNGSMRNNSVFTEIWKEAEESMAEVLDNITFAGLSSKVKRTNNVLTYQI